MEEWVPPAIGFGVITLLFAIVLLLPNTWLGLELRRAYQVQTSGVLGRFSPRDFLRSAGMSLALAAILAVSAYIAMTLSFKKRSTTSLLLEGYGFGFFLLAGMTVLASLQTLGRSLRLLRTERQIARQVADQPALYAAIRDILERHDLAGIAELEERGEFDYQAGRILSALSRCNSYEQVLGMLRGYYAVWFPWGSPGNFAVVAQELWNLRSS